MKRIIAFFAAIALVLSTSFAAFAETSQSQVLKSGGENSDKWAADKVKVSKTITGTNTENVFDITLKVETQQNIETMYQDPDVAICIVMDISNTMMEDYGDGKTKYEAAIESAEVFIDEFAEFTSGAQSKLGFVAFNTDSTQIAAMQRCDTQTRANTFKNTVRNNTQNIIDRYADHNSTYYKNKRYTNIEAGLRRARSMMAGCTNKNKYVVFLSDGLPTTYCTSSTNYTGYTPISTSGSLNVDGVFRDGIYRSRTGSGYIQYGSNYSDKGAIRARQEANRLKTDGVKVYSVGAGLNKFGGSVVSQVSTWNSDAKVENLSGEKLIQNQMARAWYAHVYTIDNNFGALSSYNTTTINNNHWEIGNFKGGTSGSYAALGSGKLFENWLTYAVGSGKGYYYDTANTSQLRDKFAQIFTDLKKKITEESAKAWIVTDPMGSNLEFLGFYNKSGNLVNTNLSGEIGVNKENTATKSGSSFNWELQKSGYSTSGSGSTTTYTYTLKYRVRLTNEKSGFVDGAENATNGTTTLSYETIVDSHISDMKYINFPVPSVKGYLTDLEFNKVDQYGRPVVGAEFQLHHDTGTCKVCRGNGTSVPATGYLADKTVTSNASGKVIINNIPSGHKYTLVETKAPANYTKDETVYHVTVAYDALTTDLKDNKVTDPMVEYHIKLLKFDQVSQQQKALPGAKFDVYSDAACTTKAKRPDNTVIGELVTDSNGFADMGILDINTSYFLKESKAPDGYDMLSTVVEIKITPGQTDPVTAQYGTSSFTVIKEEGQTLVYTVKIPNTPGVKLPETGGEGTLPYLLGGTGLTMLSMMLYGFRNFKIH